jgi:cytoskeletal protein CcmA (bactofilin family)
MAIFKNSDDGSTPTPSSMSSKSGAPPAPGQVNIIGQGTVIEGGLKAKSDVRISGKVIGNVNVDGKTVVTPEGVVEGEVRSTHADIAGKVDGEVFVSERLVLKNSAVVEGNIHTPKLVIEDGATFSGTCDMGGTMPKQGARSGVGAGTGAKAGAPSSSDERSEKRTDRPSDRSTTPTNS